MVTLGYIMISEPLQLKKVRMIGYIIICIPLQTQLMQVLLGHLYTTDTPEVQQTLKIQPLIQTRIRNNP